MKRRKKKKQSTSQPQSTLYLKFIVVYIIFGFLILFTVATLTSGLTYKSLKESTADSLYQEANVVATNYLPAYFSKSVSSTDIYIQLNGMKSYMNAALWFVDKDGNMIASARPDSYSRTPSSIEDFNPAESGSDTYQEGDYHGYFDEEVLTVIAPVTQGFSTKGYLLIQQY